MGEEGPQASQYNANAIRFLHYLLHGNGHYPNTPQQLANLHVAKNTLLSRGKPQYTRCGPEQTMNICLAYFSLWWQGKLPQTTKHLTSHGAQGGRIACSSGGKSRKARPPQQLSALTVATISRLYHIQGTLKGFQLAGCHRL